MFFVNRTETVHGTLLLFPVFISPIVWNMCEHLHNESAGADLGEGCRGCAPPPPPEMTCGFLIQLVFCKKKTMWFIGVEVEQETSAPSPKKNPGSAPDRYISKSYTRSKNTIYRAGAAVVSTITSL